MHNTLRVLSLIEWLLLPMKIIFTFEGGKQSSQERLAVMITSEDIPDGQLLGVPATASGTGEEIAQGVLKLLDEWGIGAEHIAGLSFDTTASNTGAWNGACVLLEKALECKILYLPCCHHMLSTFQSTLADPPKELKILYSRNLASPGMICSIKGSTCQPSGN